MPAVANPSNDGGGERHDGALFGDPRRNEGLGIGLEVKDLDAAGVMVEMRDCICENRAPFPGPCQAFVDKASGVRMAQIR